METLKIKVLTVQERNRGEGVSRYGNRVTSNSTVFKSLLINAIDENENNIYFFTPNVKIAKCTGYVNYEKLDSNNGWYKMEKGEKLVAHGHSMFDGGSTPNVAIKDTSKPVPAISAGDVIEIKGNHVWTAYNGNKKYNRVKLIR